MVRLEGAWYNLALSKLPRALFRAAILGTFCFWAIANWWHAVQEVARFYIDLPVWDYFDTISHYARYKAADWSVLWIQHNEHRIVFPEMIFALDLLMLRGQIILPTVLSLCFHFGVWLTMVWAFWKDDAIAPIARYSAIFLGAILIVWKGCAIALGIPFLMQWTMNQFAAILALAFLAKLYKSKKAVWLAPLCACGVLCNYSSGNGLLLWPLLIAIALLLRLPRRQNVILAAVGAVSIGLYFVGYKPLAPLQWRLLVNHPIYFAEFMASYVSMPFAKLRSGEPLFGVHIGLVSLATLGLFAFLAWRAKLLKTTTGIVLFGYCATILSCGVMTALGRMNPFDPLLQSPKAPRYMTEPLTYWSVLAFISIWVTARYFRFFGTAFATVLAVAIGLLLFRMSHKAGLNNWYDLEVTNSFANQQWAALAVENGILDPVPDRILFSDANYVVAWTPLMRSERLSLFAKPEVNWIGRDWETVFPEPMRAPTEGGIVASQRLATAVTLAGWTVARSSLGHPLELVLVDESHRIVGIGSRLPAGLPERLSKFNISAERQWSGFVNLDYKSHTVSPYVVSEDGKGLIPLGCSLNVDAVK